MKDLLELSLIVTKTKLRAVELVGASSSNKSSSKLQQFYDLLLEGRFKDDDEAAHYFYAKDKNDPGYQKLRKTLKDRLVNSLFIIDLKAATYTDRQKAYYECYKEWAAAKILFGKNARTVATGLCKKILKIARKYEFTELIVDICHALRLYYGTIEGDIKKFHQYNEEFNLASQLWLEENRAEELYIILIINFINSKSTKTDFQEMAKASYLQLSSALDRYDSYQLHLYGSLIQVAIYTSVNDYMQTINVCDRAIAFFEKKEFIANISLHIFHYEKLICYFQLRQFDQAIQTANVCLKYLEEGTFNWFKLYELYFLVYMHNSEFAQAEKVIGTILSHPLFMSLPENIQESWRIFEAYVHFVESMGLLPRGKDESYKNGSFRLAKFFNETRTFSKDKQGMNIPILIVELLFAIAKKKRDDAFLDRLEAIDKYRMRYLREAQLKRTNIFLKMLLLFPKNGFKRESIIAKTEHYLAALHELPIEVANQAHEIEIIPYEKLWQMLLNATEASTGRA